MNQSDFNDEILRNIRGKSKNNWNEILNNFTDTDFEIDTFSESPYIDIDSLIEQLIPHTKKFSVLSVNIQSINTKFDKLLALIIYLNDNNLRRHRVHYDVIAMNEATRATLVLISVHQGPFSVSCSE